MKNLSQIETTFVIFRRRRIQKNRAGTINVPALNVRQNVGIQEVRAYAIMAMREYVLWSVIRWNGKI